MSAGFLRSLVVAAVAAAAGLIIGRALYWTVFQAITLACSLGLFAYWLRRFRAGDDGGILENPRAGAAVLIALSFFAWAAFFTDLAVHLRLGRAVGSHWLFGGFEVPRFLSMGLALLPAAPYAAYVLVALIPSREA